jgi:aminomethyltransferase
MSELRKTPLHEVHLASGARLVAFGGWDMPVEYSGLIAEHQAVRSAAGLFDVSHMGELEVTGPGALAFLQRVTANDVAKLAIGQAQYSALPMPTGCPVDDIIIYRRGPERYLIVVNAANIARDWAWLQSQQPSGCTLEDRSDAVALIALQGPRAEAILQGLTALDLRAIGFYRFAEGGVCGHEAIVARTGYTGEDGFELFVAPAVAASVWRLLIEAGRPLGLLPAGLGARDTLRLEARMLLYGNDIDDTTTLIEAGLGWVVSFDDAKGDFSGRAVLLEQKTKGAPRKLVGFETTERGIPRHGYPVFLDGEQAGSVTSGTFAPFLQKGIGLAYLPTARAAVGSELAVGIRGRRIGARVVPTPFYKRPR